MKLPAKHAAFVAQYLVDLNATQAAIRSGYSPKTAKQQGSRLLSKAAISSAIAAAQKDRAERVEVSQDEVLRELLRIARADLSRAFDPKTGNLLPLHEIPEDLRRSISSVETDELFDGHGEDRRQVGVTRKLKLWDKPKSLEMLMRHLGAFKDKVEHSFDGSFADLLKEARARAQRK